MALFGKKKKELIPETNSGVPSGGYSGGGTTDGSSSYAGSSRGGPPAYVAPSMGGGGYGQQAPNYSNNHGPSGTYGSHGYPEDRKTTNNNNHYDGNRNAQQSDRNRLLSRSSSSNTSNSYAARAPAPQGEAGTEASQLNEEDEEVEGIKQQMRFTNHESLASTRNAVRIAREAEETGRATLDRLGLQSDRIANTERHLDMAKAHNDRAADETKELNALNRSIFRPSFVFNKSGKRDKEEQRILNRHNEEAAERGLTRSEQYESRERINGAYREMDRMAENAAESNSRTRAKGPERAKYQFEATESDNEVEDEIDANLNDMSDVVGRLKALAMASGQEVEAQNRKLERLDPKVAGLSNKITLNTQRLGRIK